MACSPSTRDYVPESKDIRITDPSARDSGAAPQETYVHVAQRDHAIIGLAEARNMKAEDANAIVDHLADDLERCAMTLASQKMLVEGAARVVAVAGPNGTPGLNVKLAPGDAVAQNALMCLIAPVRAVTFPPSKSGPPGFAIEATWGPGKRR